MEAPEKIYVHETSALELDVKIPYSVEYIRKDAFIERACEFIAENMTCNGYTLQTKATFIKEFRKYMEE